MKCVAASDVNDRHPAFHLIEEGVSLPDLRLPQLERMAPLKLLERRPGNLAEVAIILRKNLDENHQTGEGPGFFRERMRKPAIPHATMTNAINCASESPNRIRGFRRI